MMYKCSLVRYKVCGALSDSVRPTVWIKQELSFVNSAHMPYGLCGQTE